MESLDCSRGASKSIAEETQIWGGGGGGENGLIDVTEKPKILKRFWQHI